jgi:ketosteroid isomerase-like protein
MKPETRISGIVRAYFSAYERKDRAALEELLHEGFTFGSPHDPHLDRRSYFERCWPNSRNTAAFESQRLHQGEGEADVLYACQPADGAPFSNAEYFRFDGEKVSEVLVFYGSLPKAA